MGTEPPSVGVALTTLFRSYDGRDRIARFFQYTARFAHGCTQGSAHPVLRLLHRFAARLLTSLGSSRRTFRWGKEVPALVYLESCLRDPHEDLVHHSLEISQTLSLLLFLFTDHISWLQQIRFGLRGGARTIQLSFKFLTVSCILSMSLAIKKLSSLPEAGASKQDEMSLQKRREYLFSILRNCLMAVQAAHNSSLLITHNIVVGLLGMVTSVMDVAQIWPEWRWLAEPCASAVTDCWPELKLLPAAPKSPVLRLSPPPQVVGWGPFWGVDEQPAELRRSDSSDRLVLDYARSD
mmetsp:Transcript_101097/g.184512  ORF Transcript_101097/g.184512 Transcript_101097/m.184512 type:complete len:294 (+) Transcript_101097:68-949(+)